jgi:hypothetical protein
VSFAETTALVIPAVFTCVPIGMNVPSHNVRAEIVNVEDDTRSDGPACSKRHTKKLIVKNNAGMRKFWFDEGSAGTFLVTKASRDDILVGIPVVLVVTRGNNASSRVSEVWILDHKEEIGHENWDIRHRSYLVSGTISAVQNLHDIEELSITQDSSTVEKFKLTTQARVVTIRKTTFSRLTNGVQAIVTYTIGFCDCEEEIENVLVGANGSAPPM